MYSQEAVSLFIFLFSDCGACGQNAKEEEVPKDLRDQWKPIRMELAEHAGKQKARKEKPKASEKEPAKPKRAARKACGMMRRIWRS